MGRKNRTPALIAGFLIVSLLAFLAFRFLWNRGDVSDIGPEMSLKYADNIDATYDLEETPEGLRFQNHVDGYQVTLPDGIEPSFDRYQARTRFELGSGKTLELYLTPDIPYGGSGEYYVSLVSGGEPDAPNAFSNTTDHRILSREEVRVGDFNGVQIMWDRTPLAIEGDQPHYYSVDLDIGSGAAASFFYKGAEPIDAETKALVDNVAASLELIPRTHEAFVDVDQSVRDPASMSDQTQAVLQKYFADDAPLRWGIFSPEYSGHDYTALKELEEVLGTHFRSVVHYMDVTRSDPRADVYPVLRQAHAEGRSVELTIQTINPPEGPNQVYEIINGEHDAYFEDLAQVIKESQATILLRIGNEMNGDWCLYSPVHLSRDPDLFVAFYRYLVDFFEARGVSEQMLYVWNPNGDSYPAYRWNDPTLVWPGGDYVDIVGLTAYNNGTYYSHETWDDFDSLYQPIYDSYQRLYAKPLMITEFASSDAGGDKVAWVEDMLSKIDRDYPKIKMAIWWDHKDYDPADLQTVSRNYAIDEPQELKEVFRAYFEDHHKE